MHQIQHLAFCLFGISSALVERVLTYSGYTLIKVEKSLKIIGVVNGTDEERLTELYIVKLSTKAYPLFISYIQIIYFLDLGIF